MGRDLSVIARSSCDEAIQSLLVALDCFAALAMTRTCSARERAAVLFPGRRDDFEILVRAGHRRAGGEDVPLVLDLVRRQRGYRIHLMHELMIGGAEVTLARLEQIVFGALFEMLDD